MLQVIVSKSPEVNLTDEMQFCTPRWLHRDFVADIRKHVGPLDREGALDRVIDLIYSGIPVGWFWSATERMLDRDLLREELSREPLSIRSIFNAVLTAHARHRNKPRIGAKFPMHYSYAELLLEWYPDCLLVHTTRNPKAVYASQAAKYTRRPDQGWASRAMVRFMQFVHINIQTSWTARIHKQLSHLPNYRLLRYEDMVMDPETNVRQLCEFLQIEFQPEMLSPKQFGSSYDQIGGGRAGIERSSLERWRSTISPLTANAFDACHRRAIRILGYGTASS